LESSSSESENSSKISSSSSQKDVIDPQTRFEKRMYHKIIQDRIEAESKAEAKIVKDLKKRKESMKKGRKK